MTYSCLTEAMSVIIVQVDIEARPSSLVNMAWQVMIECIWPGGSRVHMAWQVMSEYGLAGHQCTWLGGSLVYMAWRAASAYGVAGH